MVKRQLPLNTEHVAGLALADGSRWGIAVGNEPAFTIVWRLAEAMQLQHRQGPARRFLVLVEDHRTDLVAGDGTLDAPAAAAPAGDNSPYPEPSVSISCTALFSEDEDLITCVLSPAEDSNTLAVQLMWLSLLFCRHAQTRGGLLLHGGLAERDGCGVILAGPGAVGKTTASQRLPPPWRSLCDDTTLVVRDEQGAYWAHPWPTWSDFMFGGPGGTWDVQHAVPLRGIFFLAQAQEDKVEPLGVGEAVCLLIECAEQASWPMSRSMVADGVRELRLQHFDSVCSLAQTVPCYSLRLSLTGAFWHEIERAIAQNSRHAS